MSWARHGSLLVGCLISGGACGAADNATPFVPSGQAAMSYRAIDDRYRLLPPPPVPLSRSAPFLADGGAEQVPDAVGEGQAERSADDDP